MTIAGVSDVLVKVIFDVLLTRQNDLKTVCVLYQRKGVAESLLEEKCLDYKEICSKHLMCSANEYKTELTVDRTPITKITAQEP